MTYTVEVNIETIGGARGTDVSTLIATQLKAGHSIYLPDSDPNNPWIFGDIALGNSDPATSPSQRMLCNPRVRGAGKGRTFVQQLSTSSSVFGFNTTQWTGSQSIWPTVELNDMFIQGNGANKYGIIMQNDANGTLIGADLHDLTLSNFGAWAIILEDTTNVTVKDVRAINAAASGLAGGGVYVRDCGDLHMDTVAIHACGSWGFLLQGTNSPSNHANEGVRMHKCSTNTGPGLAQLGCHIENYKFVHLTDCSFTSVTGGNGLELVNAAFCSVKGGEFQGLSTTSAVLIDGQSQQNRITEIEGSGSEFGIYCQGSNNLISNNVLAYNTYGDLAMQAGTCTGNVVGLNQMLSSANVGILESGGAAANFFTYNRIYNPTSVYSPYSVVRA